MTIRYETLTTFYSEDLKRIMPGYTSSEKYMVQRTEAADGNRITFELVRVTLEAPYEKVWDHDDPETEERYTALVREGFSYGAYDGEVMVGIAITETLVWNGSLHVWEFGVAATHRGRGIGLGLMQQVEQAARSQDLRVIVAETQNTNVPAIRFYRRAGFEIDALDLSFYTNNDVDDFEVAIFMKKRLV